MKKLSMLIALTLILSVSIFAQDTYKVKAQGDTRIGLIGNIWHPVGLIVNHEFDNSVGLGLYATAKSNFEINQIPVMNQYNFTAGISFDIFQKTSDLMIGASYKVDPDNYDYSNPHYTWGVEVLLMTPFTDNNWRMIFGWYSNPVNWRYGITAGFAYQF